MPVYDYEMKPGETMSGGGAGILFMGRMGRGSKTSQTPPTEKSQDLSQTQPSSEKEDPAEFLRRTIEQRFGAQSTTNGSEVQDSLSPKAKAAMERMKMQLQKPTTAEQDKEIMNRVYGTPKKS